jgi:hypothetical protein
MPLNECLWLGSAYCGQVSSADTAIQDSRSSRNYCNLHRCKSKPIAKFPLILLFSSRILLNVVIVGQSLLWTKHQVEMAQQALLLAVMVTSTPIQEDAMVFSRLMLVLVLLKLISITTYM